MRLRAFVGRSFLPEDEACWFQIRSILESLRSIGLVFEDAKEHQLKPISEKVQQGIDRNDLYIAILTRRLSISGNQPKQNVVRRIVAAVSDTQTSLQWTTSNWVIQESGFALGKGKKVLMMIERGVDFPVADLDADTEWVPFDRSVISECSTSLVSMIGNLISENLPIVSSTSQIGAPEDSRPVEEERKESLTTSGSYGIVEHLDKQEFEEADAAFERIKETHKEDPNFEFWPLIYLRLKAIRGHIPSIDQLKEMVETEPPNYAARFQLALYYSEFKEYGPAVKILLEKAERAPEELQGTLLRRAAQELAKDNKYERAFDVIRDLIGRLTKLAELKLAFITLADVAKSLSDQMLEAAALEHVLDIDPSNGEIRFRLAYLYGEMNKRKLSAYHYTLRLNQGNDLVAINNLGVAYGTLDLKGKEIEAFERAGGDLLLSKANLSQAYVDRGFLAQAERLAEEVTKTDPDETALARAISALERISSMRSTENKTEEKILAEAGAERRFRSSYAEVFIGQPGTPIFGVFETPHGRLSFTQTLNQLVGEATLEEPVSDALAAILAPHSPPSVKIKTVKMIAKIVGRSGRFTLEITEKEKGGFLSFPNSTTSQGFLLIAEDGNSFQVLEELKTEVKLYEVRKISPKD